jgi:hypothetical protein
MKELATVLGSPLFQRIGWALLAFLWQGTLVAALVACAGVALPRRKAALRYAVGCGALLLMLAMPVATFLTHPVQPRDVRGASDLRVATGPAAAPAVRVSSAPSGPQPRRELLAYSGAAPGLDALPRRGLAARRPPASPWLAAGPRRGSRPPRRPRPKPARDASRPRKPVSRPVSSCSRRRSPCRRRSEQSGPSYCFPSAPPRVFRRKRSRPSSRTSSRTSAATTTWSTFCRRLSRRSSSTTRPSGGSRAGSGRSAKIAATTWRSWPRATRARTPARSSDSKKAAASPSSCLSRPTADLWRRVARLLPSPRAGRPRVAAGVLA